jgi:hypothetical protein
LTHTEHLGYAVVQSAKVTTCAKSSAKESFFVVICATRTVTETCLVHPARINVAIDAFIQNVKRNAAQR